MKCSDQNLFTPIYLKLNDDMPWPEHENAFYLLSRDGLFLCRNSPFSRSCVPVSNFPSELAGQQPFLRLDYPRIPRRLIEQVIGFFDIIGERYCSEAAVLVAWNRATQAVEIVVPEQTGYVGTSLRGEIYPMDLEYEVPALPPELVLIGDIHSHVDGLAYASFTDQSDEAHRPGFHLVIGRILDEPPQMHCEAVTDGVRFRVRDLSLILEGYYCRRVKEVPAEWIRQVTVKPWSSKCRPYLGSGASTSSGTTFSAPAASQGLEARSMTPDNEETSAPNPHVEPGTAGSPAPDPDSKKS